MNIAEIGSQVLLPAARIERKPSVAIVMPYNPKMMPKQEMEGRISRVLAMAEKSLLAAHPADVVMPVLRKTQQLVRKLNSATHREGVALFVTEEIAKVDYLDFEVEERVAVDEPFLIRDIADCRPATRRYLVLVLGARQSTMYLNNGKGFKLIKSNAPQNVYAYVNEVPERSGNFSDPEARREVVLNKFLHHMDVGLGAVLKMYPLPVFVIGIERIAGHFASITRHDRDIAGYIHKQGVGATESELKALLEPLLADWRKTTEQLLLHQIEKAAEAGKLVCGIDKARKAAGCRNSRLIVVEQERVDDGGNSFYSDGEIDLLVEKVLESGGQVEKMNGRLLKPYASLALIKYY